MCRFIKVMVLALVLALLVLTAQCLPVEHGQARVYREAGDMEDMETPHESNNESMQTPQEINSIVARPILSGIETLARFTVSLHVPCFLFSLCLLIWCIHYNKESRYKRLILRFHHSFFNSRTPPSQA